MAKQGLVGAASGNYRQPEALEVEEFDHTAQKLVEDAEAWTEKAWHPARLAGWEAYHGKVDLETKPGDDDTIAYEIRDAVQQIMPDVLDQLAGTDEPMEYYTHDPAKHDFCRQATVLALSTLWEGGGWTAIHDSTVHASVGRIGFYKVYRKEELKFQDHEFQGLTPDMVAKIGAEPSYLLLELEDEYENGYDPQGDPIPYAPTHSGTVRRYYVEDKITIEAPDPSTLFCTQSTDPESALCIGQKTTLRMGNLRAMGFEPEELLDISGFEDAQQQAERSTRTREPQQTPQDYGTWALRPIDVYEVYCMIDADGDGLLERWKVIMAGTAKTVLRRTRVSEQPYAAVTIRRSPHTMAGFSFYDLLRDLQKIRTKLTRGLMENTDLINEPMLFGSGTVNFTQLQQLKKRKVVNEGVPNSVRWFSPPPIAGEVLPVLDYLKSVRSDRVGVDPAAQGLQPDQLSGIAAVAIAGAQQAAGRVTRLMVRTLAETGVRVVFQKLLRLMVGEPPQHVFGQDGKYVQVNPRAFDPAWGVRPRVGLGAVAQQERQAAYNSLLALVAQLVGGFGPINPFIDAPKLAGLIQAAVGEFKGVGAQRFFNTPDAAAAFMQQQQEQPPPPDPKMEKVKADAQLGQQKLGLDHQRGLFAIQSDTGVAQQRNQLEHADRVLELGLQVPLEKYAIDARNKSGQGNFPKRAGTGR